MKANCSTWNNLERRGEESGRTRAAKLASSDADGDGVEAADGGDAEEEE
jgi:hypothetical protein